MRTKYSVDYLWYPSSIGVHHLPASLLEPYRSIGDPPVDIILDLLDEEGTPLLPGDDLLTLATQASSIPPSTRKPSQHHLASFISYHQTLPSWVNIAQLKRGQTFYLTHLPSIALSLYYRSLIAGFAIPKIAAVIRSTGYLSKPSTPDQSLQRILDTGQLLAACICYGTEGLLSGGDGWKTALHVRALHAKIRRGLLKHRRHHQKQWDVDHYGVPINQEDMAATLLAFGTNSIIGIEFVAGVEIGRREEEDYLALWRYIGWLLGVPVVDGNTSMDGVNIKGDKNYSIDTAVIETSVLRPLDPCGPGHTGQRYQDPILHSRSVFQSIISHILNPDETSIEVAHHLLQVRAKSKSKSTKSASTHDAEANTTLMFYFRSLLCRRFIGDPLANTLELPLHPNFIIHIMLFCASTVMLLTVRMYTLAIMFIPIFRRYMVKQHGNAMRRVHKVWKKTHRSKLARALEKGERVSFGGHGTHDKFGNDKGEEGVLEVCPFAMIAPPTLNDK